jgi:hypothetical protein
MKIRLSSLLKSLFFLVVLFIIGLIACSDNADHEKYVQEYVAIQKPSYQFLPVIRHYKLVKKAIENRQEQNGFKPDLEYLDSLKNCDKLLQEEITSIISNTEKVVELDNELKIKDKTIYSLNAMSFTFKKLTAKYIKICELGGTNAKSASSKEEWEFKLIQKNADSLVSDQTNALNQFQQKYKITNSELKQHGLSD